MYFSGMKRGTLFFFSLLLVLMAHGKPELVNPSETGYGVEFAKELNLEAPPLQAGQVRWVLKVLGEDSKSAELQMTALVDKGWHLYSQKNPPNPTGFELSINGKALGQMEFKEPKAVEEEDEYLGPVAYFKEHKVVFSKTLDLCAYQSPMDIEVVVYGQVCTEDAGQCLPFEQKVKVRYTSSCGGTTPNNNQEGTTDNGAVEIDGEDADGDGIPDMEDACPAEPGKADWKGCPDSDGDGVPDHEDACPGVAGSGLDGCQEALEGQKGMWGAPHDPQRLDESARAELRAEQDCGVTAAESKTPWSIFVGGFLAGFLALLTPCVFPMIPLTVSFFTKQSSNRSKGLMNAFTYAISIMAIYTGLGFLITVIFGTSALNAMATSAFWNLLFFVVFVVFAISFLGAFEIVLPAKFVNAVDKGSNKGGLIGIFFMAFTLSLVSFSCTGPLIGTLLVEAANTGNFIAPLLGMFGFSVSLAMPFALFAAFPGWLNSLPKSGGWLNSVKVNLGFLELALALKFLSTVDMAYHWDFLYRERFIAIWVAIFGLQSLYLLGLFKTSHDSPGEVKLKVPRILFTTLILSFTIYLIPGMWGAPLKLLAGLAPPMHYTEGAMEEGHCPMGLECSNDYGEGMQRAAEEGKPLFIDFTGYGCTNCRLMEENVWTKSGNLALLETEFQVVSLYCDDKTAIPDGEQMISPVTGELMATYGRQWSDFQSYYFGQQSQPLYILLDHKGRLLGDSYGYDPDPEKFKQWLLCGLSRFESRQ